MSMVGSMEPYPPTKSVREIQKLARPKLWVRIAMMWKSIAKYFLVASFVILCSSAAYGQTANQFMVPITEAPAGSCPFLQMANQDDSVALWWCSAFDGAWHQFGGGGGGGTVTSFSSGNLSPLFTTSVSNPNTTPALSFSLSNVADKTFFGNHSGGVAAPSFIQPACSDLSDSASGCSTAAGANTALSNISSTAAGADINPGTDSTYKLGTLTGPFKWLSGAFGANDIRTTPTDSIFLYNSQASDAVNTVQYSPALHFEGSAWKSNATAASQLHDWRLFVIPSTGTGSTTNVLSFQSSVNGGAYSQRLSVSNSGTVTGLIFDPSGDNFGQIGEVTNRFNSIYGKNVYSIDNAIGTGTITSAGLFEGLFARNTTAATSGAQQQNSPPLNLVGTTWNSSGSPGSEQWQSAMQLIPTAGTTTTAKTIIGHANTTQFTSNAEDFSVSSAGIVNARVGYTVAGAAANGNCLVGDGTKFVSNSCGGNAITALTGDVTATGPGSVAATVVNLPDGVTQAGHLLATNIAAPASPGAGKVKLFTDSTDLRFHDKNASGVIGTTVVSDTGAANNFLTAISAAGAISKARPTCGNLSDSGTACTAVAPANTTATSHQFFTAYTSATGAFTKAQPACADLSDSSIFCTATGINNAQTATYQVLAADFTNLKTITVASGTFTITLVDTATQPANGKYINVINYGSGVVTIARSGQNINGGTSSITLPASSATAPSAAQVFSDGTNYFATVDSGTIGTVTSVATTSPITGGTITGTGTIACATCAIGPGSSTAGHVATFSGTDGITLADGGAPGTGTVSTFSAGTLSPLFTTSVANATTTPALSFSLSNANGGTLFGNNTASAAAPAFTTAPVLGVDNTTAGTLQLANSAANAHNILSAGATTTNTFQLPATVPTTGHVLDCTTTTTTCLVHDSGLVTANVVTASGTLTSGQLMSGAGTKTAQVTDLTGAVTTAGGVATTLARGYPIQFGVPSTAFTCSNGGGTNTFMGMSGAPNATETSVIRFVAPEAYTIGKLYAASSAGVPTGQSVDVTVMDNTSAQAVTCNIAAAGTSCNDTAHSFTTTAGHLLDIRLTCKSGTTGWTSFVSVSLSAK